MQRRPWGGEIGWCRQRHLVEHDNLPRDPEAYGTHSLRQRRVEADRLLLAI